VRESFFEEAKESVLKGRKREGLFGSKVPGMPDFTRAYANLTGWGLDITSGMRGDKL